MSASPETDYPPSGCHHCGLTPLGHFQRWADAARATIPTTDRSTR